MNPLIPHWFGARPHKSVNSFATQHEEGSRQKISLANFSIEISLSPEGEVRPVTKESQNGLEDPENRRSAGRHGNQHVYVRHPQVSGRDSFTF
jgi:hypothetical protein